jgi:multiple sugar transport system permease protein
MTKRFEFGRLVFLAPWLLGFILFTAGPALVSLVLSFTNYSLFTSPRWVGLANYRQLFFSDSNFHSALIVTTAYVVVSVPLCLAAALGVATLLTGASLSNYIYRTIFYIPSLLGASVAVAILWKQVFGINGLVNDALSAVGVVGPSWISDPRFALSTLIALNVWQFGIPMVLFIAGLKQIPRELYEAALIDGASAWRKFTRITLPMLSPVILLAIIFLTINSFQAFTQDFIISGGSGGPLNATLFLSLYIYQEGFIYFHMGYASAIAWILLIMTGTMSGLFIYSSRWWVHYGGR